MRERARDKGRLEDILEYSNNVTMLIQGFDYESLVSDKRTYYAVMKNIEVVGEAAYMLTKAFKKAHPETPWKVVQGMRHVLVHDYANVVSATLYDTAVNDIPMLRGQIEKYLEETDWGKWESTEDDDVHVAHDTADEYHIQVARRMKEKGYSTNEIADITGLSDEEIVNL